MCFQAWIKQVINKILNDCDFHDILSIDNTGSPADNAGVKNGDVIIALNGIPLK